MILIAFGCSAPPRPTVVVAPRPACIIAAHPAAAVDSLSVAMTSTVAAAHAPVPANDAERFVFSQLYETLLNADCEGRPYPGLARSWITDESRTRVTLVLRDGARLSNGDPLRAPDVVAAWRTTGETGGDAARLARRIADATTIVDDRTLIVSLPDTSMLVLAEPALAVYRMEAGAAWPSGSGPYRVLEPVTGAAVGSLRLMPVDSNAGPRLVIRTRQDADARDAIDAGTDLLVTGDPVALRYASASADVVTVPLPWNRTYALALPRPLPGLSDVLLPAGRDSAVTFRAALARDAVRGEARPAEPPLWWGDARECPLNNPNPVPAADGTDARPVRIVYRRDDPVARAIAERYVALGRGATAAPLASADFARSLRAGNQPAYVVALPHRSLAPCVDLAALASALPWLAIGAGDSLLTSGIVALVDTRERAVVRRDRVSATIDWDGTLHIRPAGGTP